MNTLSPATERKLMKCVDDTAGHVNDGLSPDDSIIKAASDNGLRPGEIALVVHAYNTGRTARQRTEGDDPFEKSAEFDLADTGTILEKMYPTTVKTAAAVARENVISTDYGYGPKPMLERLGRREKVARDIDWRAGISEGDDPITAPAPYPSDPRAAMKKASSDVDRLGRDVSEHRRKMASAFDQMGKTFMDLTEYFRRPGSKPMPVVKEAVMMMHGDKGEQIMDELIKVTPGLTKFANHTTIQTTTGITVPARHMSVDQLDCQAEPFDKIAQLIGEITEYKHHRDAYQIKNAEATEQAEVLRGPFVGAPVSQSILGPSLDDSREKKAFGGSSWLGNISGMGLAKAGLGHAASGMKALPDEQTEVNKTLDQLTDPSHEQQLRDIGTQAMLQDLLVNDPVISAHDPEEVTSAFNDLSQLAPAASGQRVLMQGLLRKQLEQGQLDQFDLDQVLGMEDKLRKQKAPQINGVAPDGSII